MSFRERLVVPGAWWAIAMGVSLSSAVALGFYFGPVVAALAGGLTTAAVAAALWRYGRVLVEVDQVGIHAGGACLEWPYVGSVTAKDAAATRARFGRDADPHAWLVMRGFISTSVEIAVADPADPHPYWLISTRRPGDFVAAVDQVRQTSPETGEGSSPARLPQ